MFFAFKPHQCFREAIFLYGGFGRVSEMFRQYDVWFRAPPTNYVDSNSSEWRNYTKQNITKSKIVGLNAYI